MRGKSYAKRVLLSTHTAIRAYRHTFLLRPLIGAGLQTHASNGFPVGIYPTKLVFCINFATEFFVHKHAWSCRRLETLTAEALRKDYLTQDLTLPYFTPTSTQRCPVSRHKLQKKRPAVRRLSIWALVALFLPGNERSRASGSKRPAILTAVVGLPYSRGENSDTVSDKLTLRIATRRRVL